MIPKKEETTDLRKVFKEKEAIEKTVTTARPSMKELDMPIAPRYFNILRNNYKEQQDHLKSIRDLGVHSVGSEGFPVSNFTSKN